MSPPKDNDLKRHNSDVELTFEDDGARMGAVLPDFEECEAAIADGDATPLQRFIFNHEPAGREDERFRFDLGVVIEEARNRLRDFISYQLEDPPGGITDVPLGPFERAQDYLDQ